jgi:hypothetical protein
MTAVSAWPGTTQAPHRFGGVEFLIGDREIGHLHGDSLLDVPFPKKVRNELVASGLASPHHILPESGWTSFRLNRPADIDAAIALLRRSFDLINAQLERRKTQSAVAKGNTA